MKYIPTNWDEPKYNMAMEEYIMDSDAFDNDYFFFYIHRPSVIIGKNQNAFAEVNMDYVKKNNIIVCRRQTGGGAVYHDRGNLNFSFIEQKRENEISFEKFTRPIIAALRELGVNATLSGRNDILVDSKKISGNSQRKNAKKTLHHGTIMFDVNVEEMVKSLNVNEAKFVSKAVKSVKSRVANLKDIITKPMDTMAFKQYLLEFLTKELSLEEFNLSTQDEVQIEKIADEKYGNDAYTFGSNPPFELNTSKKFDFGLINLGLNVKDGKIEKIKITGDFFFSKDIGELEKKIEGSFYSVDSVSAAIANIEVGDYIDKMKKNELLELIFDN